MTLRSVGSPKGEVMLDEFDELQYPTVPSGSFSGPRLKVLDQVQVPALDEARGRTQLVIESWPAT